jgi:hypothetical protein
VAGRWFAVVSVSVLVALAGCATVHRGEVDGSLLTFPNGSSRPSVGTVTVSSRGREVARVRTDRIGFFSMHLAQGTYTLDGTTAAGVKCRSETVKIRNSGGDSLTLICI